MYISNGRVAYPSYSVTPAPSCGQAIVPTCRRQRYQRENGTQGRHRHEVGVSMNIPPVIVDRRFRSSS